VPTARNGDVELHYEAFGTAGDPVLLLVNGLGSQCINYRVEWCEQFVAEGFRVVRFDNRDVGRSTHLSDGDPYTLDDMASDALAVLDAVGAERAHVAGVSMGGMIVQALAIAHPERLWSMTSIMSSTGDADVGTSAPGVLELILRPPARSREEHIDRQVEQAHAFGSPAHLDDDRVAAWAAEAYDRCFDPGGHARQVRAITSSPSRTEALGAVRVPALVIHGDADTLVHWSGGQRTAEAIPGARFELIDGMGHDYPPPLWPTLTRLVADHAKAAV